MCRHFDLNVRRGLERLFLMEVDTKDLNRGGGGVRIINGMAQYALGQHSYQLFAMFISIFIDKS